MTPRPFPFPLRIGTDLCRVERIAQIIKARDTADPGQPLRRFLSKILTYPERAYFRQRFGNNDAVFHNLQNASTFLAGRYEMSGAR
jgi:holo-[acyl-carrier protein] synthase